MSELFIWVPSYGSAVTTKPNVEVAKFGDGYEQRVGTSINTRARKWEVTFASRPNATADAIVEFLETAGAVQCFAWVPPHGNPGKWVCREWSEAQTGPYTRTVTATFEEVFGG